MTFFASRKRDVCTERAGKEGSANLASEKASLGHWLGVVLGVIEEAYSTNELMELLYSMLAFLTLRLPELWCFLATVIKIAPACLTTSQPSGQPNKVRTSRRSAVRVDACFKEQVNL